MILYRGANLTTIKPVDWYITNGILINSSNGGNPKTILSKPILDLIQRHVYPEIDISNYHNYSDFLSFSSDKSIASNYLSKNKKLQTKFDQNPNGILFSWDIENLEEISAGIYEFKYDINFKKSGQIISSIENISKRLKYELSLQENEKNLESKKANVLLFNLKEIISVTNFDPETERRILRDSEWLILPSDINKYDLTLGLETYIYPNKFFNYEFYKFVV